MIQTSRGISADEKRWRAESDADALKRYAELKQDPARLASANKILQQEAQKTSKAISLSKPSKAAPKKKTAKKK